MHVNNELTAREFIRKVFIEETERLIQDGSFHFAFVIMAQGIETLGGFLDTKPLKAKDQSKLRFSHAINRLMPKRYAELNNNHALYDKFRASLAHTFTVSRQIILTSKNNPVNGKKHLQQTNEKLIFVAEDFYEDFKKACNRLLEAMDKGMVTEKKMNERYYYSF